KQDRNVAKTNDPFGIIGEPAEIQPVDDTHSSISTPCTEDGLQAGVVYHLLQIGRSFHVGAAKAEVPFAYCIADLYRKAPALYLLNGRFYLLQCNKPRRTGDADGVARREIVGDTGWYGLHNLWIPHRSPQYRKGSRRPYGKEGRKKMFTLHDSE